MATARAHASLPERLVVTSAGARGTTTRLSFTSKGTTCAATLYRPAGQAGAVPCVVMGHGFTGTQELLQPYAERFVQAGLAALTFDYRSFGQSEGEPRQVVNLERQLDDWRAALAFARRLDGVGKVALWGSSLSGGHVIKLAAEDPAIAAVVAQVPALDKSAEGMSADAKAKVARLGLTRLQLVMLYLRVIVAALYDALRAVLRLEPYYIKVFGRPGELAAFTDPAEFPTLARFESTAPRWQNRFAPRFMFGVPRYRPGTAERVQAPLLVCAVEHDTEANPALAAKVAHAAPRGELKMYPGSHFDAYYGATFAQMVRDEAEFLRRHLL